MVVLKLMGFGSKSSELIKKLIISELKFQSKGVGNLKKKYSFVRVPYDGVWHIVVATKKRNSFAKACAILQEISQSTPGQLVIKSEFLSESIVLGPETPPKIEGK